MKSKIKIALSNSVTDAKHDDFVNANPPNQRCPLDAFMRRILAASHGGGIVTNDLRAFPVITYSVNGNYIGWFDTTEDIGFLKK